MRIYNYESKEKPAKKRTGFNYKKIRSFGKKIFTKKTFTWVFRIAALGVLVIALMFLYYTRNLPDPNKLLARQIPESTKIFDREGNLLYEIHGEFKRTQVNLDQISDDLKHATIAIEDKDFYRHGGISYTGIGRAIIVDITHGSKVQGGSTITQQFVKKAMLSDDKSWDRKIRELILSLAIESKFSKDDILKLYLNEIPYGRNAYGIEAASQTYFNKSAKDLNLAESAYLAALPQAPSRYNPMGPNREALDNRKNTVLAAMREQGYITAEQEEQAKNEKVAFTNSKTAISAPHFVLMVQDYLTSKYGESTLQQGGLKVYTTLDPKLQKIAEDAVKSGAETNGKKYNAYNAALVAMDPKTGQILALVGSKDYFGKSEPEGCTPGKNCMFEPNVNVALSQRQPGSSFKPYVYVTAFKPEFKYAPATMLMDVVTNFGTYGGKSYIPHNYDGREHGVVSMRTALAGSLNIPAVKTLDLVGVDNAVKTAHDLGITSPLQNCGLSLVLGGCEVRLLDHVAAYSTIANLGTKNDMTAILKVEDNQGRVMEEYHSDQRQVLDPQAAYELISIMTDNNARSYVFGSNSPLILKDRVVAAKTGTTNDWGDGWTMGFTPSLAAGVWTGNNCGGTRCPMKRGADGVLTAAPIWNSFMKQALASMPAEDFTTPSGIKKVTVDAVSGKLPTDLTPSTKVETFADYSVPTQYDDVHVSVATDSATGQPATSLTPPSQIVYQTYTVFHSEKPANPSWENPVIAWATASGYSYPPQSGQYIPPANTGNGPNVEIVSPSDGATISRLPIRLVISASSAKSISRIDLSVDGQFITSLNSAPYTYDLSNNYSDGQHTIAVKAVDSDGAVSDTSVTVTYALNAPLTLLGLDPNSNLSLPHILTAESTNNYDVVSFYYTDGFGATKLIGQSQSTYLGDRYQYTATWQAGVPKGTYRVYVQSSSGMTSPKVRLVIK